MNIDRLYTILNNPQLTSANDTNALSNMVLSFPYFHAAHIIYLNNLRIENCDEFNIQLQKSAVYVPDRHVLFNLMYKMVEPDAPELMEVPIGSSKRAEDFQLEDSKPILAAQEEELTTEEGVSAEAKTELLELDDHDTVPEKTPEEREIVSSVENEHTSSLIDKFISESPVFKPQVLDISEERPDISLNSVNEDNELVTETLANIYIMQKLYDKAISVFEKLILKYPEKSTYFASRIEETQKLIK